MPMELLRQLAKQQLPLALYAPADLDRLRVLRAAGFVEALIPPVETLEGGAHVHKAAQVLCVTPEGRRALESPEPKPLGDSAGQPRQAGSDEPPPEPVPGQDDPNPQPVDPQPPAGDAAPPVSQNRQQQAGSNRTRLPSDG